jgi:prophage antirepressor-like protein
MENNNYQLIPFEFNQTDLSIYMIDREPHWIGADIYEVLDLKDTSNISRILDEDEYLKRKVYVSGQDRSVILVNESGLYHLIFSSRKDQAKSFRRWVTHEVLPSIRKTGRYSLNGNKVEFDQSDIINLIEAERKGSSFARQVLLDYGFNPAPASTNPNQLPLFNPEAGGELRMKN